MSSEEELELAIETCKDFIIRAPKDSDKQKNLVKKLIQLRLKLQELKVCNFSTLYMVHKLIKFDTCIELI